SRGEQQESPGACSGWLPPLESSVFALLLYRHWLMNGACSLHSTATGPISESGSLKHLNPLRILRKSGCTTVCRGAMERQGLRLDACSRYRIWMMRNANRAGDSAEHNAGIWNRLFP